MILNYEEIRKANETIITTEIERKDKDGNIISKSYAEVNQRIKAFRMVFPDGSILTELVSNENGVCIFRAICGYRNENGELIILGSGTAYEKENSTFINKTSYIENCETSAVGRALGMAGFGIDTSVASAEEVTNAMNNQNKEQKEEPEKLKERKASSKQVEILKKYYTGENYTKLLQANNIEKVEDISMKKASFLISKLRERNENNEQ